MDFCTTTNSTTSTATSFDDMLHSPTSLSLQDLITAPAKAESLLELLTPDQILAIEQTLSKIKRRRLDKEPAKEQIVNDNTIHTLVSPTASPTTSPISTPASAFTTTANVTMKTNVPTSLSTTKQSNNSSTQNEPVTEVKDGVEWVSFVYSHNRTLKRYSIRTDLQQVDTSIIDGKFKSENCVYPRANLPKEEYHGNRWAYETECNILGWKLAWLNKEEIAGKRGLIQRAVDSYRNRYPSMRSRRVARQEKLLNGTLRKRKHREGEDILSDYPDMASSLCGITIQSAHHPKTIAIEDTVNGQRFRIKINVESVDLEEINVEFRKANCPYSRVMNTPQPVVNNIRWMEETMCNELAWKLAWLNPRHLAGKKNMLQRALDVYRSKFMPSLQPRKNSNRVAPIPLPSLNTTIDQNASLMDLLPISPIENGTLTTTIPLTTDALSAQNALYEKTTVVSLAATSPTMTNMSGTTESLDFADCFSLADEDNKDENSFVVTNMNNDDDAAVFCDLVLHEPLSLFGNNEQQHMDDDNSMSRMNSTSSYSSDSAACTPSPVSLSADPFTTDFFNQFIMPATDDPFFNAIDNIDSATADDLSKLYNTNLGDSSALAANLLDPLF